jgi:hypothetical protein
MAYILENILVGVAAEKVLPVLKVQKRIFNYIKRDIILMVK